MRNRKSDVCSSMYASRYCLHCWHVGQILKQSWKGSLDSSQASHEVLTKNKRLHAHLLKVRSVRDHWIFLLRFAGCRDSMKSTSGYIYLLARGVISWKSVKQSIVASSTMATEFVAFYEASNHGILLRNFVTGLRILDGIERPLKLFGDNKPTVLYSNNNRSSRKSKFIGIKFLVVKEMVQSGLISIEHIGTNSMIADPLTKGLPPKVFHEHTAHMGMVSLQDMLF